MASRRLAISSLLCGDDPSAAPVAGPSRSPLSEAFPSYESVRNTAQRDAHEIRTGYAAHQTQSEYIQSTPEDVIPLSFQPAAHLRRHTPSPSVSPQAYPLTGSPSRRRSFKDIAFDDYQGQPGRPHDSVPHISDTTDYKARSYAPRRGSTQMNAVSTLPEPTHPSSTHTYTASEPSQSYRRPRRPSSGEPHSRPPSLRHSTSSIHTLVNGPWKSPPAYHPSQQQLPAWPEHPHTSPPPQEAHSSLVSPASAPRPSASPVQSRYRQPRLETVSPTFSTTSQVPSPPSSSSSQRPQSRHTIASLLTDSPSVLRASAASLPHILNSPTQLREGVALSPSSSPHVAHMGGLEALVQAATQERRRLSGEIQTEVVGTGVSSSTLSSPVLERGKHNPRSSPISERGVFESSTTVFGRVNRSQPQSPNVHRLSSYATSPFHSPTHAFPSPSPQQGDAAQPAFASISPQPAQADTRRSRSPPVMREGKPPAKRRRGSDGPIAHQSAPRLPLECTPIPTDILPNQLPPTHSPRDTTFVVAHPESVKLQSKSERSVSPTAGRTSPSVPVKAEYTPALVEIQPSPSLPSFQRTHSPVRARKPPSENKKPLVSSPHTLLVPASSDSQLSPSTGQEQPRYSNGDADEQNAAHVAPPAKKKKVEDKAPYKEPFTTTAHSGALERTPVQSSLPLPDRADGTEDEDPHDWLMEHYGGVSSSYVPPGPTLRLDNSAVNDSNLHRHSHLRGSGTSAGSTTKSLAQAEKRASKNPKDLRPVTKKARSPTPTAMLEEEIGVVEDEIVRSRPATAKTADGGKAAEVEMDLDAELDFVAGPGVTNTGAGRKGHNTSDMDVEDEILSLLDDNPRPHRGSPRAHLSSEDMTAASPVTVVLTAEEHPIPHPNPTNPGKHKVSIKHTDKSDRESMPPPPHTPDLHKGQDLMSRKGDASTSASTKKKEGITKSVGKKQTSAKPKASRATPVSRATPKGHSKDGSSTPAPSASGSTLAVPSNGKVKKTSPHPGSSASGTGAAAKRLATGASSRSRSTSVMPGVHETDKASEKKASDEAVEGPVADDKLYCICKTKYDEDRVMIACDRCDEWYHTQCVDMPDLEVDLVDQFICPTCIASNSHLSLKTTYKRRCYSGLQHPHPSSPSACHKPARGAVSKYCSDECAVKYMQSKIRKWGGDKAGLWEGVKDADKREAVVVRCLADGRNDVRGVAKVTAQSNGDAVEVQTEVVKPSKTKIQREIDRLHSLLSRLPVRRDALKKEDDVLVWREHLVELAIARADSVGQCGWDQRLCFGDDEVAEFGTEVLQSYDQFRDDGSSDATGEWWCRGKKKCERHAGWQKLRQAETELDREVLNASIDKITAEERDLRNRIEDMLKEVNPSSILGRKPSPSIDGTVSLKLANGGGSGTAEVNGTNSARTKINGVGKDHGGRKGKKRKPE